MHTITREVRSLPLVPALQSFRKHRAVSGEQSQRRTRQGGTYARVGPDKQGHRRTYLRADMSTEPKATGGQGRRCICRGGGEGRGRGHRHPAACERDRPLRKHQG